MKMKRIDELFGIRRARSGLFSEYEPGNVAYIGNGLSDNAVTGFVTPLAGDRVFTFRGIAVSAFCEATVQAPPFIACGRAGNGLTVLEPTTPMEPRQLAYIAAYINLAVRWRFSWYRQTTADRVGTLLVPSEVPPALDFDVQSELPPISTSGPPKWNMHMEHFSLGSLYKVVPGDYHSLAELPPGPIPIVSCGDANNGISGFVDVAPDHIYDHRLTIAFNGMNTLTAKYHPYRFAAKDDVAVCWPLTPLRVSTELFIEVMLSRERWRYSYYRKCFVDKLIRFAVPLPSRDGKPDEDTMQAVVEVAPYWPFVATRLSGHR